MCDIKGTAACFEGVGSNLEKIIENIGKKYNENQIYQVKCYCDRAEKVIGLNLWDVITEKTKIASNMLSIAESVLTYICGIITYDKFSELLGTPDVLLGYSLGLNTAMTCSNSLLFEDGVRILYDLGNAILCVRKKCDLGMAIIVGLTVNEIEKLINAYKNVKIASENSDYCIIITGLTKNLNLVLEKATEEGALNAKMLDVPFAYHYGIKSKEFNNYINTIEKIELNKPKIAIMSVYNQQKMNTVSLLKNELARNVFTQMQWKNTIQHLEKSKISVFWDISFNSSISKITALEEESSEFYSYNLLLKKEKMGEFLNGRNRI